MSDLNDFDRRLLSLLKSDGRASVTTLAATLGAARGTVQSRLNRLITTKRIKRFTVELNDVDTDLVHAIMMLKVHEKKGPSVHRALQRMPEVTSLHRTFGAWEMIIRIETVSLADFDTTITRIRALPGVAGTETHQLLRRSF